MSETFACPQCGKSYPHAGRKPGKAVICVCGHRFLVPAPEVRQPRAELPLHPAPMVPPPAPTPSKSPTAATPAARHESRSTPSPASTPRSARSPSAVPRSTKPAFSNPPRAPQPPPELEAEVVDPGDSAEILPLAEVVVPAAEVVIPAAEIVTPAPYAIDPLAALSSAYEPAAAPLAGPLTSNRTSRSSGDSSELFGLWVGRIVLFALVPLAGLCVLVGHVQMYRNGGIILNSGRGVTALRGSSGAVRRPAGPAPGNLLTITGAGRTANNLSVQYTLQFMPSGFIPRPSDRYYWIVACAQGSIEFPIRYTDLAQGHSLVGKPGGSALQFRPPMTTWIESQTTGSRSRQRVSNEISF